MKNSAFFSSQNICCVFSARHIENICKVMSKNVKTAFDFLLHFSVNVSGSSFL